MRRRAGKAVALVAPVLAAVLLVPQIHPGGQRAAAVRTFTPDPQRTARATLRGDWFLGVREHEAPRSWAPVTTFVRASGLRPRIVEYYSGWRKPFRIAWAQRAHRHGAALLVQMEPWGANLGYLSRGGYDGYLRSFAHQVRDFGHAVIIGFGHEMNGWWYPWGYGHVPPAVFVAAWRHVVGVFRSAGADNVTWLWTIHHTADTARIRKYWPGSGFVTWIGIDGYYEFPANTFGELFGRTAKAVRTFTAKPVLISETAVGPGAGDVPAKIRNLFAGVLRDHFLGLVWFDVAQHTPPYHQDWRLEGKAADLSAFLAAARVFRAARIRRAHERNTISSRPSLP